MYLKTILSLGLFWIALNLAAQRTESMDFDFPKEKRVNLNLKYASAISISVWSEKKVRIVVSANVHNNTQNDKLNWTSQSTDNRLWVESNLDLEKEFYSTQNENERFYTKIYYEIKLPKDTKLSIESLSGDIEIMGLRNDLYAKSLSGFVDFTWPQNLGADVTVKSISGEVYTNHSLEIDGELKKYPIVGYRISGKLNGGGTDIELESISGDVYFRKEDGS